MLQSVNVYRLTYGATYDDIVYASPLLANGSAVMSNVIVKDSSVTVIGNENRRSIGGLVGKSYNLNVSNCLVDNFVVEVRIGGDGRQVGFLIGGMGGTVNKATVLASDSDITINSDAEFHILYVGGLFGRNVELTTVTQTVAQLIANTPYSAAA